MTTQDEANTIFGHGLSRLLRALENRRGRWRPAAGGWLHTRLHRYRMAQDLRRLDSLSLRRELAEWGIAPADVPRLIRSYPESAALLDRMMDHLRVDRGWLKANPRMAREIERSCALCACRRRCRKWMKTQQPADGHRAFCPNSSNFAVIPRQGNYRTAPDRRPEKR